MAGKNFFTRRIATPPAALRRLSGSRKTERGTSCFWFRWVVRAAPFALMAGVLLADLTETLAPALHHPAVGYFRPGSDPVAKLDARLKSGAAQLTYDARAGYLRSVLDLLNVPVESQVAVFSKTSFQASLIHPGNPRTIFFNDSVAVAWMYGGFIELAAQDPKLGTLFYTLDPARRARPRFERNDACTRCHQSDESLGIPGLMARSVFTAPGGEQMLIYGAAFPDHRTPLDRRWGGWYVTGAGAGVRHMGNTTVVDRDKPEAVMNAEPLASLQGKFPAARYLSTHSDVAALLVLDHQTHMSNLITRMGWEARVAAQEKRPDYARVLAEGAREFVDYLLFVEEAPLKGAVNGTSGFAERFSAQGPRDAKGRSLRQLDLEKRLLKFPCSYMLYSEAFDGMPDDARAAIYRRMWAVLSGVEKDRKYARLTAADRTAVVEILRGTKPEVGGYFR